MTAQIVVLRQSNFRDPVATLRVIADEIEAGKYGKVSCIGISLLGDKLSVFGAGPDSDGSSVGMVLQAGFQEMVRAIQEHGK